ncbi:Uncharacterised protein [Citrobacter werkmanii]|uniref:Uncharacterized protein n=1 Tax=Citrobacter werkmanii TaxID=67827 RepID=A0A9N8CMY6_9ENTR|nr:Uncharacterised protein [Citrobacter werkmanii]CAB5527443.1 Uncharacterised protein [Citrobacter werkmanii]CAB5529292.1 Uncharacterised protein [Citrobacter werkmanii]CAB5538250.1 Uncharacterised protein [Citrobacter werkmanii]CAB5557295.1 Uncharacterised protein [Citrobacter werkmanii]
MFCPMPIGITYRFCFLGFCPNLSVFRFTAFSYPTTTFQWLTICTFNPDWQRVYRNNGWQLVILVTQRIILNNNFICREP